MKRITSLYLIIPLLFVRCYSYTSTHIDEEPGQGASSPGRLLLPDQVLDKRGNHYSAFSPTAGTTAMAKELFAGTNSALQINMRTTVSPSESNGIEVLGLLTLCILPCGVHRDMTIEVSYLFNGIPLETETYKARYQVWGGLIIGAVGVEKMAEHPDLNSAIQAVLPVVAARSHSVINSRGAKNASDATTWLTEGIPPDTILNINNGLLKLDAVHFSCLENPKIHRCDAFYGNEFQGAAQKAENATIRMKKYVLLSNWSIGSEKLAKYDFQKQNFPVAQTRIETDDFFWNIDFVHRDAKDSIDPERRYTFLYSEDSGRPFYSMQQNSAEKFRNERRGLRLSAIAEIQAPTTRERTLYTCILRNGQTIYSFSDGDLCRKTGTTTTKHVYFKIIRWVLTEENGNGIQKGQ